MRTSVQPDILSDFNEIANRVSLFSKQVQVVTKIAFGRDGIATRLLRSSALFHEERIFEHSHKPSIPRTPRSTRLSQSPLRLQVGLPSLQMGKVISR